MRKRFDVTLLICVDCFDRNPIQLIAVFQTADEHFNLKFKSLFRRIKHVKHQPAADETVTGLVVAYILPDCPGEDQPASSVASPPDERHAFEFTCTDDEIGFVLSKAL